MAEGTHHEHVRSDFARVTLQNLRNWPAPAIHSRNGRDNIMMREVVSQSVTEVRVRQFLLIRDRGYRNHLRPPQELKGVRDRTRRNPTSIPSEHHMLETWLSGHLLRDQ